MDSGAAKKASLDDLSREDLVTKCKNLLKLAQQAKSAKDDLKRLLDVKEAEISKSSAETDVLKSQVEDKEDIITVKQRQLDRISDENESLLKQMDTYASQ